MPIDRDDTRLDDETPRPDEKPPVDRNAHAIDIDSLLTEIESDSASDIDTMLSEIEEGQAAEPAAPAPEEPAPPPIVSDDIDDVFKQMRDEASTRLPGEAAEIEYKRALVLRAVGDLDGCIKALEAAATAPKMCFAASALLGKIYKERGELPRSLEWLDRAAQAPPPTPAEYHDVLYELADALEASGDVARALAVSVELQAEAGPYRDVDARVSRLARVQARG